MQTRTAGRRARRRFSTELKAGPVHRVLEEGITIGSVGRELDLVLSALGSWVPRAQADATRRMAKSARRATNDGLKQRKLAAH